MVARLWNAVVDVILAEQTSKAWVRTFRFREIAKDTASEAIMGLNVNFLSIESRCYSILPSAHSQSYPLGRSIHLAPFKQGVLEHSSMSIWHISPLKPENTSQNNMIECFQTKLFEKNWCCVKYNLLHVKQTCWTLADKTADLVMTFPLVQTWWAETLIHLYLTVSPLKSWTHENNADSDIVLLQCHLNLVVSVF